MNEGMDKICTRKMRDKNDKIIIQEKLDGSSCAVARINEILVPVTRKGWQANTSKYKQHRLFSDWFYKNQNEFEFLENNQRLCGEWMAQAHGTKYKLQHEPFVAFDLLGPGGAKTLDVFNSIVPSFFPRPYLLHEGGPITIQEVDKLIGEFGHHGALELAEGAVYRVEREGRLDFMAKYVRADKKPGQYLGDHEEIYNEGLEKYL